MKHISNIILASLIVIGLSTKQAQSHNPGPGLALVAAGWCLATIGTTAGTVAYTALAVKHAKKGNKQEALAFGVAAAGSGLATALLLEPFLPMKDR